MPIHLGSCIQGACNDEGLCYTVDRVCEWSRLMPALEADLITSNATGRDRHCENEEYDNSNDFDPASPTLALNDPQFKLE